MWPLAVQWGRALELTIQALSPGANYLGSCPDLPRHRSWMYTAVRLWMRGPCWVCPWGTPGPADPAQQGVQAGLTAVHWAGSIAVCTCLSPAPRDWGPQAKPGGALFRKIWASQPGVPCFCLEVAPAQMHRFEDLKVISARYPKSSSNHPQSYH